MELILLIFIVVLIISIFLPILAYVLPFLIILWIINYLIKLYRSKHESSNSTDSNIIDAEYHDYEDDGQ